MNFELFVISIICFILHGLGFFRAIGDLIYWASGKQAIDEAEAKKALKEVNAIMDREYRKNLREYQKALENGESWAVSLHNREKRKKMKMALENRGFGGF